MREDPGGGVGGVQDTSTFPFSAWGEALISGGGEVSIANNVKMFDSEICTIIINKIKITCK